MRYISYLAGKLAAAAALLALAWKGLRAWWPEPYSFDEVKLDPFGRDLGYTAAVMLFSLMAVGLIYLVILDQRFRCRTCLRRLRMPVTRGTWNQFLLGVPSTEYICPYGHGTLRVEDVHLAGVSDMNWKPIDDMWKELEELETTKR
ncbi:MAG: hypothetical protein FJW20_16770 [Acidimicrobiia bacterium]|nr:hypothetical protein [Acidimicrobiia bacterium]